MGDAGQSPLIRKLREQLAKGIADEAAGRRIAESERRRDLFLVDLLALKAGRKTVRRGAGPDDDFAPKNEPVPRGREARVAVGGFSTR
jgi:hypothetical protein